MPRPRVVTVLLAAVYGLLAGCQGSPARQWEIVAENQSDVPCTVAVDLGPGNGARVDALTKGKPHILLFGSTKLVIRSAKVVRGKEEQELKPDVEVPAGKRYFIVVAPDGKATASVVDR